MVLKLFLQNGEPQSRLCLKNGGTVMVEVAAVSTASSGFIGAAGRGLLYQTKSGTCAHWSQQLSG